MAIAKDASKEEKPKRTPVRNLRRGTAKRKLSLYIGNFPWVCFALITPTFNDLDQHWFDWILSLCQSVLPVDLWFRPCVHGSAAGSERCYRRQVCWEQSKRPVQGVSGCRRSVCFSDLSVMCNDSIYFTVSFSYAEVSVTSEESLKSLLEKVPGCNLNGETVDCRFATQQNLSIFEEKASQRKGSTVLGKGWGFFALCVPFILVPSLSFRYTPACSF